MIPALAAFVRARDAVQATFDALTANETRMDALAVEAAALPLGSPERDGLYARIDIGLAANRVLLGTLGPKIAAESAARNALHEGDYIASRAMTAPAEAA